MSGRWKPYTIVPEHEIRHLQGRLGDAPPGPVLVAGSFRGGDVMALMEAGPARRFVVVDSFRGTADPLPGLDGTAHPRGDFSAGGVEGYLRGFEREGFPRPETVEIYIDGTTLRRVPSLPYAMAWLDLDHYSPTLDCIGHFWPMLAPGGIMLTHDYGWPDTPGIRLACDRSGLAWAAVPGTHIAFAKKD